MMISVLAESSQTSGPVSLTPCPRTRRPWRTGEPAAAGDVEVLGDAEVLGCYVGCEGEDLRG